MSLSLLIIRCPDTVAPERRDVTGGEFSIGRGPDNDWILADPDRHLSKRHCQIAFRSGQWVLTDTSSNGTFVNHAPSPLGQGQEWTLRDGDRITLGTFEIEVRLDEHARPDTFSPFSSPFEAGGARGGLTPGMLDPFAEPAPPPRPFGDRFGTSDGLPGALPDSASLRLPDDFDPLSPSEDPFPGPTQSDHAPALDAAFRPPGGSVIPDDWDLDLSVGPTPAGGAGMPDPFASPVPPQRLPHTSPPPVADLPATPMAPSPPFVPPPSRAVPPAPPQAMVPPAPRALAPAAPANASPPDLSDSALLAAFLLGTGLGEQTVPDPAGTLQSAGAALRAAVSGLRQALIARASIKGEFRIEQTMIRASGNNPLKFSAGDDDALAALLGVGRRNTVAPDVAMADALRDMRLHELATVTAMQTAVRALLARFTPAEIERQAEKGGFSVLPGQRKARAWDAFEAMHAEVTGALADNFDSVFGKSFAKAYEQAMDELSSRGEMP
ncbi:type VI secretion system-associated FHA domain protein TagH [Roseomonas sp. WA12]